MRTACKAEVDLVHEQPIRSKYLEQMSDLSF